MPEGQELPPVPSGFQILPRRWVVERTFGCLGRNRRLSKDYESLPESEEAFVYLGMVRLMLNRLVSLLRFWLFRHALKVIANYYFKGSTQKLGMYDL